MSQALPEPTLFEKIRSLPAEKMAEVNEAKKLARTSPPEKTIQGWIDAAKTMDPKISY